MAITRIRGTAPGYAPDGSNAVAATRTRDTRIAAGPAGDRPRRRGWRAVGKLLIPLVLASTVIATTALTSLAKPNLPDVGAHRHWLRTGSGAWVEVGPRYCDDERLYEAFKQFHYNVHLEQPGKIQGRGCLAGPPLP